MMKVWRTGVRIAISAALLLTGAAARGEALAVPASIDPLLRPAPVTTKGAAALLLAVTTAGKRLVAVGERGLILTSDDNGATWRQAKVPVSVLLTGARFATPQRGWAVGHSGVVLRTDDGGNTWSKQLDGTAAAQLVLAAAKDHAARHADDAAAQRQVADAERLVNDGADKPFFDIHVENENSVLIVGAYGLALRTEDGGKNWQAWQDRIPNERGAHLYAIRAAADALYIAGEQGVVLVSHDRGQSFAPLKMPYAGSFFGLAVLSQQRLVVYGLRGNCFWSADGGATWQESRRDVQTSLNGGVVLGDGSVMVVSQAGNLLRSVDGGQSFVTQKIESPSPFVGVAQAADGSLVLVGARGVTRLSTLAPVATRAAGGAS